MATRSIPLFGGTYTPDSTDQSRQELKNVYLEEAQGLENVQWTIRRMPGMAEYLDLSGSVVRAAYEHKDKGYVVVDDQVHQITDGSPPTNTLLGTLTTSTGRVSITSIDDELLFADGDKAYSFIPSSSTWAEVTDGDLPADVQIVAAMDGYFIAINPGTDQHHQSAVNDATDWDATHFASANSHSDNIVSCVTTSTRVWFLCEETSEIWYNAANASGSAFSRVSGGVLQYGCAAPFTALEIDNQVYWLAQNKNGLVGVMRASEGKTEIVSNRPFVQEVESYLSIEDAYAWTYQQKGHTFYVITFPSETGLTGKSWALDITTNQWTIWESVDTDGLLNPDMIRHRANCGMYLNGKHVVGDFESGKLFHISPTYLQDNGSDVPHEVTSQHLILNQEFMTISRLEIDVESDIALDGAGQGSDPQIILQVSKDRGKNWGPEIWRSAGKLGEYRKRVLYTSLGTARSFTFRLKFSDPVDWLILGAYAQVTSRAISGG